MHKVFRIRGGHNLHIIHESRTGHNRSYNVYVLCDVRPKSGERELGSATCPDCSQLDNPTLMNDDAKRRFYFHETNDLASTIRSHEGKMQLLKRDYEDADGKLTPRGRIIALDWTTRPSPAASVSGVVHARHPISNIPICATCGVLAGFDRMSTDRYAKLRALDLHITCVACLYRQ